MPEGFMGGFAQGMSPLLQSLMYAQALRNSGMTNPATGAPYSADQGGGLLSRAGNWLGQQLGFTRAPYTAANPYIPSVANGGIAPATPGAVSDRGAPGAPMPYVAPWASAGGGAGATITPGYTNVTGAPVPMNQPLPVPPMPPGGTGTTQGQRVQRRPLPIPPTPFPQSPIAQQGPPQPLPRPPPRPPSPIPVNAGDVGSGSLMYQPGGMGGYGAFGNITAAPGAAQNFQGQFGWGLPGSRQNYRKWFTERFGQAPQG